MNNMYDDYNIVKATVDAINNAEHNKTFTNNQKKSGTKKPLIEDDGNSPFINENFENIENLIANTKGLVENAQLDGITIENIYFIQDMIKYSLLQIQDKINGINIEQMNSRGSVEARTKQEEITD